MSGDQLPSFPVSDDALDAIEHAMSGAFRVNEAGDHELTGADFSFGRLLDFYSGYDSTLEIEDAEDSRVVHYPRPIYTKEDVIRSLIAEVRRLRETEETA